MLGAAFAALEQKPVAAAVGIDLAQLVGPWLGRADLAGIVAMDGAAAPLPGVDDVGAVRGQHRIDVHFR